MRSKTRVPTQLHGFFHLEGGKKERKRESVLPAKRCIIENHLECDYLQPPSNAVHLPPLTWWITSFYDGNGSLPRRAPIKGEGGWPVYFHSSSATGFPLLSAHRMDPPIFRPFRHEAAPCFGIVPLSWLVRADLSAASDRETKTGRRWRVVCLVKIDRVDGKVGRFRKREYFGTFGFGKRSRSRFFK